MRHSRVRPLSKAAGPRPITPLLVLRRPGAVLLSLEEAPAGREGVGVETVASVADRSEESLGAAELAVGGSDLEVKVGCS